MTWQLAFLLGDWRNMATAPRDARWIEGKTERGVVKMHFAQDLSGSDQPAFSGWFREGGCGFIEVWPAPYAWRYYPPIEDKILNPWYKPYDLRT